MDPIDDLADVLPHLLEPEFGVPESAVVVHRVVAGDTAVFAVRFEDRAGADRRSLIGLERRDGGWRASGGYTGSAAVTGPDEVWVCSGGWRGDSRAHSVFGGWVADPTATSARLGDPITGVELSAEVVDGVAVFVHREAPRLDTARVDLLDREGQVLRSGRAWRRRR